MVVGGDRGPPRWTGLDRLLSNYARHTWLELLLQHVPDQGEHLVRYYGWYSNRSRGVRKQLAKKSANPEVIVNEAPVDPAFSRAARAAWARLIQKVYEIDPLLCPHCGAEMRLMALIEDSLVIENILI